MKLCKQHTSHGEEHRLFRKMGEKRKSSAETKNYSKMQICPPW